MKRTPSSLLLVLFLVHSTIFPEHVSRWGDSPVGIHMIRALLRDVLGTIGDSDCHDLLYCKTAHVLIAPEQKL